MQIVQERWDGSVEVYNFKSIYSEAHSHIHYPNKYDKKNKVVYRNLNNPTNDMHGFYPTPEEAQFGAIPRSSIYDFDYTFEQIKSYILNNLDKSHLEQVLLYLGNLNQDDKIEKTR